MGETENLVWVIPEDYPFVLFTVVLLCVECFIFSYWTIRIRKKVFNREWLTDNFEEEHIQ